MPGEGFQKGNKLGPGRPYKGRDKISTSTRARLEKLFSENMPKVRKELKELKGAEYLEAITKMLPFIVPKLQASDLKVETTTNSSPSPLKGLSAETLRRLLLEMEAQQADVIELPTPKQIAQNAK
jgi:hypothetical protein